MGSSGQEKKLYENSFPASDWDGEEKFHFFLSLLLRNIPPHASLFWDESLVPYEMSGEVRVWPVPSFFFHENQAADGISAILPSSQRSEGEEEEEEGGGEGGEEGAVLVISAGLGGHKKAEQSLLEWDKSRPN